MSIQRVAAGPGLPSGFPFSLAAGNESAFFISGMPALDPDGKFVPGSFEEETVLAWRNTIAIAREAGYSEQDIVYVQCILGDINDYQALNAWWRGTFPDPSIAPARFTYQAGALPFGAKIELQAVACRARD